MNKEEKYIPKIRTGEQLEREQYLLCFKSKSMLASMLIDAEEKIDKAIEFCNYLLKNEEVEIDGVKYFKQESDDVITRAILEKIQMSKGKDLDPFLDIEIDEEDLPF